VKHGQSTHENSKTKNIVGYPLVPDVDEQPVSPTRTTLNCSIIEVCGPIIVKRKERLRSTQKKNHALKRVENGKSLLLHAKFPFIQLRLVK